MHLVHTVFGGVLTCDYVSQCGVITKVINYYYRVILGPFCHLFNKRILDWITVIVISK